MSDPLALPRQGPPGSPPHPDDQSLRVGGADLDHAVTLFREIYAIDRLRVKKPDGEFSWQHTSRGTSLVTLRTSWFAGVLGGVTPEADELIVMWDSRGTSVIRGQGDEVRLAGPEPVLLPFLGPTAYEHHDTAQNLLHLNRALFQGMADEHGAQEAVLADQGPRRLLAGHGPAWTHVVRTLSTMVPAGQPLSPVAEMVLAQTAGTAILRHFYGVESAVDAAVGPRSRTGDLLREYLHENPSRPVTTADLAALVDMTPRAVQLIMRSETGLTPTGYFRMVRLHEARRALQTRGPDESIAEVARRWGFFHLGRFASAYRERFGESPRATRRR